MEELRDPSSILVIVPAQTTLQWTEVPEVPGCWQQPEQDNSVKGHEPGAGGNPSTGTVTEAGAIPQALNTAGSAAC